jgi:site-specific recombinase XerD
VKNAPMRGVFERPPGSGVWWINYYDSAGRRHRERVGRYSIAVEAYLQRRQEVREGRFTPPKSATRIAFRDLTALALAHKKMFLALRSYESDCYMSGRLCETVGNLAVAEFTTALIEETLQKYREQGLTGSTVNKYRSFISSVFSFAVRSGRLPSNPCAKVKRYPNNESRTRFLSDAEESQLRQVIRRDYPESEAEFDLALHTGIRRGEQFSLLRELRESVDLERGMITVRGKTGERHVPINSRARMALEQLLCRSTKPPVLPRRYKANARRDWRKWLEKSIREAKIANFTWHDLRHTFASRLVMAGVDLSTVQKLLGHKSILMTMRYAHLSPSHTSAAVEKIVRTTAQVPGGCSSRTARRTWQKSQRSDCVPK